MKKNFTVFAIRLLVYTIVLFVVYYFIKNSIPPKFYFENAIYVFAFFLIITCVFHYGLLRASAKNNRSIVLYYMIATALKLFLFLSIIIVFALIDRSHAIAFISNFFGLYIFFTVFEVVTVYRHFKSRAADVEIPVSEEPTN